MLNSNDLINKVKVYNKFLNPERLDKAFNFAVKAPNPEPNTTPKRGRYSDSCSIK